MNVDEFKPYCLFDDPTRRPVVISQRQVGGTIKNGEVKKGAVKGHVIEEQSMQEVEKEAIKGQDVQEWDTTLELFCHNYMKKP